MEENKAPQPTLDVTEAETQPLPKIGSGRIGVILYIYIYFIYIYIIAAANLNGGD